MASFEKKGVLGGFTGKVGTIVASTWGDIPYIRSLPKKSKRPNPIRDVQNAKFKIAATFMRSMSDLFNVTFRGFAGKMTGRNESLSNILTKAIEGEYPDFSLRYSEVQVAKGGLPKAYNPTVASAAGKLNFTWADNSVLGSAKPLDKAILVCYCEDHDASMYTLNGGERSTGSGVLDVSFFTGKEVHTWIAFISENGKLISDSVYTGAITVV